VFHFVLIGVLCGCLTMLPRPDSSIAQVRFKIFPHIARQGESYHLQYQLAATAKVQWVRTVYKRVRNDTAFFYFRAPISHPEAGQLVMRSVNNGLIKFAKVDAIYWLNEDGSRKKLKIVDRANQPTQISP
jgi:hypothetical protein